MIISKPAIIFHTSQAFFNFLSMACFASVASFQAKWGVGPCEHHPLHSQRLSLTFSHTRSWSHRFRSIRIRVWHFPLNLLVVRPCGLRKVRQVRSPRACPAGGTRRVHSHGSRVYLQSSHRVRPSSSASVYPFLMHRASRLFYI